MPIQKGEDWGERQPVPDNAVVVHSDAEAAAVISDARRASSPPPPLLLTGGDIARTLGGGRGGVEPVERTHVKLDIGAVLLDGKIHWFIAHLVAKRSWWRGRVVVAANAAFLGAWNIAPRAHPGDGKLDVLDGDPPLGDRWKARRRLPSGTHVPHPDISVRRVEAVQLDLDRPTPIVLDGRPCGKARSLSLRVEPAAVDVWI